MLSPATDSIGVVAMRGDLHPRTVGPLVQNASRGGQVNLMLIAPSNQATPAAIPTRAFPPVNLIAGKLLLSPTPQPLAVAILVEVHGHHLCPHDISARSGHATE
jgi:hypothetical protein